MAEEKKPGFFKRLFGWGKSAPEPAAPAPEALPPPEAAVEVLPEPVAPPAPLPEPVADARPDDVAPGVVVVEIATPAVDAVDAPVPVPSEVPVAAEPPVAPAPPAPETIAPVAPSAKLRPAPKPKPAPPVVDMPEPPLEPVEAPAAIPVAPVEPEPVATPVTQDPPAPQVAPAEPAAFVVAAEPVEVAPAPQPKRSFWQRLKEGLSRTSSSLTTGITDLFTKRKLDATTLEDLEDILIQADIGIEASARIAKAVGAGRYEKGVTPDAVRAILAREVADILRPVAKPLAIPPGAKPVTILMVGVNGSGKTTTIGKLAAKFRAEGMKVVLAAGDTFRAAAIEQLKVWGNRTGVPVIAREQGTDAAGLAFDALKQAQETGADVLLIDTAGRLQNKQGLMEELAKIVRVLKKLDPEAPHATLLVLDATVGQNAVSQLDAFRQIAGVTGMVMTKLDGTARGGILVALAQKFGVPIHLIGVGEGVDDLEVFDPDAFARAIAGLEEGA